MASAAACCMIVFTCLIALTDLGLGIAEIVMGSLHLADCPVQTKIPIYLIVAGCVGVIFAVSTLVRLKRVRNAADGQNASEQSKGERCLSSILGLLSTFAFAWLICGTVWVFTVSPSFEPIRNGTSAGMATTTVASLATANATSPTGPTGSTYCYQTLYKFAMASVLLRYAVAALNILLVFCACCACCGVVIGALCCAACADKEEGREEHREQGVSMVGK